MTPEFLGGLGLVVLIILLFARMWIGAAMALVGLVGYAAILGPKAALGVVSQIPFTTVGDYPLSAVPLFIFMGVILFYTNIGQDLFESAYKWVGSFRGGLAMASTVACAFYAAITGVSAPALSTMGKVALPKMREYRYNERLAVGSIICAGPLAFIIPPSMSFIIYGILTENSVGELYIAGIIPGLLLVFLFCLTVWLITLRNPQAGSPGPKTTVREKIAALKGTWHAILLFLLMLGGIYAGVFTPTEAGAVGSFGAILIGVFTRRLKFKDFLASLFEAGQTTAMVMFLIVGAYIFMKFMAVSRLPALLGATAAALPVSRWVILLALVVVYTILGMFLDIFSAIILTMPITYPLILQLGFDPIWFGVMVTLWVMMGEVTPPVGLDAYLFSGLSGVPLSTVFSSVWPFLIAEYVCMILIACFPQLALWLPSMMVVK
ncbi:TRAP transporter large permease [Moorella sulfitireducens]|uniref:TRAP transporter large permease n=1 Tax=Neomoorella sulfitireducens TaxID=2972948 RepID=UPI0021ACA807|nr:TRAP transporter large permease [Moorella sulfitireducens]